MIPLDEEKRTFSLKDRWQMLLEDVAGIDWKRWPTFRKQTYSYHMSGIEFTWREGVGIGLGLGVLDLWIGWPRKQEFLHYKGCGHLNRFGKPYKNLKPAEV